MGQYADDLVQEYEKGYTPDSAKQPTTNQPLEETKQASKPAVLVDAVETTRTEDLVDQLNKLGFWKYIIYFLFWWALVPILIAPQIKQNTLKWCFVGLWVILLMTGFIRVEEPVEEAPRSSIADVQEIVIEKETAETPAIINDTKGDQESYLAESMEVVEVVRESLANFGGFLTSNSDPDTWSEADVAYIMEQVVTIKTGYISLKEITPPAHMVQTHQYMLEGMKKYDEAMDSFIDGIVSDDETLIYRAASLMGEGTEYIEMSTIQLQRESI